MNAKQLLTEYVTLHPDFWEFENELKEVERLTELCQAEEKKQSAEMTETNKTINYEYRVGTQYFTVAVN